LEQERAPAEIPVPREQRRAEFRTRRLPLVVWGAAVLFLLATFVGRSVEHRHVAIAQAREFELSIPRDGVIASIGVDLLERVEPGTVIASLGDPELEHLLAVSEATVGQLRDEIDAARATHRAEQSRTLSEWETDRRRFQMDAENRRLEALALRVDVESARVEEERQALEVRRARSLLDAELLSEAEYEAARLLHQEVRRRLAETETLLARTEEELRTSEDRRVEYERVAPTVAGEEPVVRPLEAAVGVELRRLADLERQRDALVLRSPVAGQVTQLLCREGQAVVAGEPVAVVTERSVQEVVAWLLEQDASRIEVATPVVLSRRGNGATGESVVVRVAESIQPLPERFWRDARSPIYGRAVIIAPVAALDLAPGEILDVRFRAAR
jgi:multidrug resistance efflux pump